MFNCMQTKILRGIAPILLRGRLNLRTSEVQQSSNKARLVNKIFARGRPYYEKRAPKFYDFRGQQSGNKDR